MLGVELHTNGFVETQWMEIFCILVDKTQNVYFSVDSHAALWRKCPTDYGAVL